MDIWEYIKYGIVVVGCLAIICVVTLRNYDVTDDLVAKKRSGLLLYIDYGTGCQYLGGLFGGITPRLNKKGRHICE